MQTSSGSSCARNSVNSGEAIRQEGPAELTHPDVRNIVRTTASDLYKSPNRRRRGFSLYFEYVEPESLVRPEVFTQICPTLPRFGRGHSLPGERLRNSSCSCSGYRMYTHAGLVLCRGMMLRSAAKALRVSAWAKCGLSIGLMV